MAVPKRRLGKQYTRRRRAANMQMAARNVVECPKCHAPKLSHRVCPECGTYNGRDVFETEAE